MWQKNFNPRSRAGSDKTGRMKLRHLRNFNPRSRAGSDPSRATCHRICLLYFNPRSRAGSDHKRQDGRDQSASYFNPRSRAGSDAVLDKNSTATTKFQSTLPRGERLVGLAGDLASFKFQSTLPRGERRGSCAPAKSVCVTNFNPRSRAGSDTSWLEYGGYAVQFQSTLPRGERHKTCRYF